MVYLYYWFFIYYLSICNRRVSWLEQVCFDLRLLQITKNFRYEKNYIKDRFKNSIDKQIASNKGRNIFINTPETFRFTEAIIEAIYNLKESEIGSEILLADYGANKASEKFCRVNHYYFFDKESRRGLSMIYAVLFTNIREGSSIDEMSKNHYKKIQSLIKEYNPFAEKLYLNAGSHVEPVACSEYNAGLQIEIRQIKHQQLKEPVLDIGCGKQGNLVNYFSQKGIEIYGIDRHSFTSDIFFNADWLEYNYGLQKWGTIISNLGFSNHFRHHNLREDGNYIEYGKKYMQILNSLKTGGQFYYTPDLPSVEKYIDLNQFRIDKKEIGKYGFSVAKVTRLI